MRCNIAEAKVKVLVAGNAELFIDARQLLVHQSEVALTGLEYNLLLLLLTDTPALVMHEKIAQQVFSLPFKDCQACISTHISHLRTKLALAQSGLVIKSIRGQGYYVSLQTIAKCCDNTASCSAM
ncbi:hypothetical protein tinsulaeT_19360 [Thalassotalea insulae]|uniref:OmpR/PhoB-type domain-containing protein n=1 Tax=Thalassotalea insulae TaxID=2056778 RepID=A0ABQ6GRP4_9GAMM|nr:winged helix-turn-helix domain-containing protein [Thalassotalea insulae]GLX78596.1 hypothetical protein tinsulaeT_19360 [Thalassotalea insulae]